MGRIVVSFILLIFSFSATAEIPRLSFPTGTWQGSFVVKEVKTFFDGYGNTVLVAKVEGVGRTLSTGCPNTDSLGLVAYWAAGNINPTMQAFLSTLFVAKSQQKEVELLVGGGCNDSHGARFHGVNLLD